MMNPTREQLEKANCALRKALTAAERDGVDAYTLGLSAMDLAGYLLFSSVGRERTEFALACAYERIRDGTYDGMIESMQGAAAPSWRH